jgi:hypothetical protein
MAGKHPIHIHPVRPLYRIAATGLGASMWFFVRILSQMVDMSAFTDFYAVDVSGEERRYLPQPPAMRDQI